jgi:hypothetical protein
METLTQSIHIPPAPRLRLLLVCVSFPFSLQFFTRLAAVFAEEVGGFGVFESDGPI